MYKKLVLIICLLFGVGSAFAFNICLNQQASCQTGEDKSFEEPPIHASIKGEEEPCLCEDEMNCEWFNINEHIVEPTGALHYSPNYHSPYYSCVVKDKHLWYPDPKVRCDRHHTARVCYALYSWEMR